MTQSNILPRLCGWLVLSAGIGLTFFGAIRILSAGSGLLSLVLVIFIITTGSIASGIAATAVGTRLRPSKPIRL